MKYKFSKNTSTNDVMMRLENQFISKKDAHTCYEFILLEALGTQKRACLSKARH